MVWENVRMNTLICTLESWQTALVILVPILAVAVIVFAWCGIPRKQKNDERKKPVQQQPIKSSDEKPERASSSIVEHTEAPAAESAAQIKAREETAEAPAADQIEETSGEQAPDEAPSLTTSETPIAETKQPKFTVRYSKSFTARLILASDEIKGYYAALANKLISYKKVKCRASWAVASFNRGREKLAKINVRGKSLYLFVALEPSALESYRVKDASGKKRYAAVPAMLKIKSDRALKRALALIDELATKKTLEAYTPKTEFKASDYPTDTLENLLARKLIKENKVKPVAQPAPQAPVIKTVLKTVTVTQAQKLITNEAAATLVTVKSGAPVIGKKYPVNIDVLSAAFNSGDAVDIAALKAKRLVPQKESAVKILARGTLDKKLTVYADDFSADAVKMIALTGGKAIKGKK